MAATHAAFAASASQSPWRQTSPLLTPRSGAGIVEVHSLIYAIGGVDGVHFLKSSEYSAIHGDGSLSDWQPGSALNEERAFFGVAAHNGFIYAVGGGNGPSGHHLLRSVERAAILPDGSLGLWHKETQSLNFPRRCAKVVAEGDYLYAIGGFGGTLFDSMERARFKADGSLGPWRLLAAKLTMPRYIHAVAETHDHLYILGGHAQQGGNGEAAAEYAKLDGHRAVTAWRATAAMQQGRYALAAATHGNELYALGGMNGATYLDVVEESRINADGSLGAWRKIAPLPAPLADFGAIVHGDWLYVIGGTNPQGYFDNVFFTRLDNNGALAAPLVRDASAPDEPMTPATRVELPNHGTVLKAIDGGIYIYLQVHTDTGPEWLAASHQDIKAGDRVRYSDGIWMHDFFSKHLQRRFDAIRFVGNLEKVDVP
jgi:Kelch motif